MNSGAAIAVIVLNWNNADDTLACLQSLRDSPTPLYVAVVDNGSVDGSAELIDASGLADVVLRTGANLGYAGGNNVGLEHVLSLTFRMVVVLNNDTVAPPDLFAGLLDRVDSIPKAAVSPTITYADEPEAVWFAGGVVEKGWPRHLQAHEIDQGHLGLESTEILTGCLIAASPSTWRSVGLFDEGYFLIFEDSDWSLRAQKAGVELYVDHDRVLQHKVSRSFRGGPMKLLATFYFVRNGLHFHVRHFPRFAPRFLWRYALRPTLRSFVGRERVQVVVFAWAGALCTLFRQKGPVPQSILRLAQRWGRASIADPS